MWDRCLTRISSGEPISCSSRTTAPAPGGSSGPGPARSASGGLPMPSNRQRAGSGVEGGREGVLSQLQERLGYRFAKAALLERALTHPSVSADREHRGGDYERLEFLGDRVLGLANRKSTRQLQSLMRNSYAVFCLKKKKHNKQ